MRKGKELIIGSRGSELALWQANHVKDQLEDCGYQVNIRIIKTKGDKIQNLSFDKIEGKGFFTKELEDALLSEEVDLAVHSLKDLETTQPEGLELAAVSKRNSPHDVLLIKQESYSEQNTWGLPENAVVGTSSCRRQAWLKQHISDVNLVDLRGNVPTRIQKLRNGDMDAIVLAEAGINRISPNVSGLHKFVLPLNEFVPAPAQGVLGLQIRSNDQRLQEAIAPLNDPQVKTEISVERGILNGIGGGCHVPLGAFCITRETDLLEVTVAYEGDKGYEKHDLVATDSASLIQKALISLGLVSS